MTTACDVFSCEKSSETEREFTRKDRGWDGTVRLCIVHATEFDFGYGFRLSQDWIDRANAARD